MATPDDRREIVLGNLKGINLDDRQIIDILLMLIDDWEIRMEVVNCIQRRTSMSAANPLISITNKAVSRSGGKPDGVDKKEGSG